MNNTIAAYENAIVSFLDILGFRDVVLNSTVDEISRMLEAVEYFNTSPKLSCDDNNTDYEPIVYNFSDTIIRIRPVDRQDNLTYRIGLLFHELLDIVHIQGELIQPKVILRGAVSYGRIFVSESRVYGPALIRAYELERDCAIYPRVIVDPDLLIEFEQNKRLWSENNKFQDEFEFVYRLLQEGDDAFWFVDYLKAIRQEVDEPEIYLKVLLNHRNLIINRARRPQITINVMQKLIWLANYQNRLVKSLNDDWFKCFDMDKDEFLITEDDIGALVNTGTEID